jgi:hypothetical protein
MSNDCTAAVYREISRSVGGVVVPYRQGVAAFRNSADPGTRPTTPHRGLGGSIGATRRESDMPVPAAVRNATYAVYAIVALVTLRLILTVVLKDDLGRVSQVRTIVL